MNLEILFGSPVTRPGPVRAGLIGVGEFGHSLIGQSLRMETLLVRALADQDTARATGVLSALGIPGDRIVVTDSKSDAANALSANRYVVVPDGVMLTGLDLDVVVEATGSPEGATRNALAAIGSGKHVAMVSKEADSVIGPELAALAAAAGVVCTPIDGDQPSLLIGLLSYVRLLGLPVVAAGKSSEHDFVWNQEEKVVTCLGERVPDEGLADQWLLGGDVAATIAARDQLLGGLPQQRAPDINEMLLVANHTGLLPDRPTMHRPIARAVELPTVLCPSADGGLLARAGTLDVFNCLRRVDEASFAGGVFVVVAVEDKATWRVLAEKGHPVSRDGRYGLLYNPQHLLGVEATASILLAGLLGKSSGSPAPRPVADMIAVATRDIAAGTVLTMDRRHQIADVEARMVPASPVTDNTPLPYYMAAGRRLRAPVSAGTAITRPMIEPVEDSALWNLRAAQDKRFFGDVE